MMTLRHLRLHPHIYKELPYEVVKDFAPIC